MQPSYLTDLTEHLRDKGIVEPCTFRELYVRIADAAAEWLRESRSPYITRKALVSALWQIEELGHTRKEAAGQQNRELRRIPTDTLGKLILEAAGEEAKVWLPTRMPGRDATHHARQVLFLDRTSAVEALRSELVPFPGKREAYLTYHVFAPGPHGKYTHMMPNGTRY